VSVYKKYGTDTNGWANLVEEDGADIVQVSKQGEEAAALLVVPQLDLVVIAARDEHGLAGMEVEATHGACGAWVHA
jgi:hypothetical protein